MVSLASKMLSVSVTLPAVAQGKTRGLLGVVDEDPSNDLMFPNGTVLPLDSSETAIYEFGNSCKYS